MNAVEIGCIAFIITIIALVIVGVVMDIIDSRKRFRKDFDAYFEEYLAPPMPETKPCPDFVPPPIKKKVVLREDLECLKCKNCGAPLNEGLKCEYCGTQWHEEKANQNTKEIIEFGISVKEFNDALRKTFGWGREND